jgi:vitamin B12 transporter
MTLVPSTPNAAPRRRHEAATIVSFAAALATCATTASVAQQPSDSATAIAPVVVTATRVPVSARVSPAAVSVITGEELRARGIARLADALRLVPGAVVASNGSFGGLTSLFLRGGNSNYVKVLVDGVPVNEPGGAFDFAHLTTDNVERIEVVRGPASVVHGSDAVAGVVQIFTGRGDGPSRAALTLRGGGYGTREAAAEASGGEARAGYSLGAAHHATAGIYPFNSAYRNTTLSASGRLGDAAVGGVRVSARYTDATAHIATDPSGEVVDSNATRRERRLVAALDADRALSQRVRLVLDAGATHVRAISDDPPDSPGDTLGFYSHDEARTDRQLADGRVDLHAGGGTVLTAGGTIEWQRVRDDARSNFPPPTTFDRSRTVRAGYAQLLAAAGERASLTLSARYDDNSKYGAFTTGRASATATVLPRIRLRAAAGNAFKEPSFFEVFNTPFTRGNPRLRPERTRSWEAGVERDLGGDRATVTASYFRQQYSGLVQYKASAGPADPDYFNLGGARASGAEATASAHLPRGATVVASYTFLETAVTDTGLGSASGFERGRPLVRRPKHSATITVTARPTAALSLGADAQYVGRRDDLDFRAFPARRVRVDAYTLLNLSAEYDLRSRVGQPVTLTARVANALDARYQAVFNFRAPRRMILVGVRVGL